ncbi:hypothetical protein EDC96DRAFT_447990 [Choanephora cucurbitarum]|nr:hypothetical protein EDC96DRAFT_447990 [Choanephora cucurbitarum]
MKSTPVQEDQVSLDFLEELFRAYKQDIKASEAVFNNMLIFPFLKAVATAVAEETSSSAELVVGETPLVSMKKQLKEDESAKLYLADGLIRLYGLKNLELLLLETSSCFGCKDRAKGSFDHHKGVFGALSMIKAAADEFYLAKVNTFVKLKILFLHAFGDTLYLWSLHYVEEGPLYELWLEASLELYTRFEDAIEHLPKAITFFWKMKCLVKEGVEVLLELQDEHKAKLKQCRFNSLPVENLKIVINPTIMKLNEAEDKAGMADLGPFFFFNLLILYTPFTMFTTTKSFSFCFIKQ